MAAIVQAGTDQHVVLVLDREQYAVPIESLREIVRWREPRPMPGPPAHAQGAVDMRGEVVMEVDLRARLGSPGTAERMQNFVMLDRVRLMEG